MTRCLQIETDPDIHSAAMSVGGDANRASSWCNHNLSFDGCVHLVGMAMVVVSVMCFCCGTHADAGDDGDRRSGTKTMSERHG